MTASGSDETRRCFRCKSVVEAAVPVCPYCGEPARPDRPTSAPSRRRLVWLSGLLVVAVLGLAVYRRTSSSQLAANCVGGQDPTVEWRTSDPKPHVAVTNLFQIDPARTPYIKLADIRTSGNAAYGEKCDHELDHIHPPVYAVAMREGANAYINNPAQTIRPDHVEVVVTAVIAHTGPVPKTIKDRYFPNSRALMIFRVTAGSPAEVAGLRPGDLLATYQGVALSSARTETLQSMPIVENETIDVEAVRGGELATLRIARQGRSKTGFSYESVPILEVTE
jgi:hypothetical protein